MDFKSSSPGWQRAVISTVASDFNSSWQIAKSASAYHFPKPCNAQNPGACAAWPFNSCACSFQVCISCRVPWSPTNLWCLPTGVSQALVFFFPLVASLPVSRAVTTNSLKTQVGSYEINPSETRKWVNNVVGDTQGPHLAKKMYSDISFLWIMNELT